MVSPGHLYEIGLQAAHVGASVAANVAAPVAVAAAARMLN